MRFNGARCGSHFPEMSWSCCAQEGLAERFIGETVDRLLGKVKRMFVADTTALMTRLRVYHMARFVWLNKRILCFLAVCRLVTKSRLGLGLKPVSAHFWRVMSFLSKITLHLEVLPVCYITPSWPFWSLEKLVQRPWYQLCGGPSCSPG